MPKAITLPHHLRGGTLMGFAIGVLVGLAFAVAVTLYVNRVPMPFLKEPTAHKPIKTAPDKTASQQTHRNQNSAQQKPSFSFYNLLPKNAVIR